MKNRGFTLAELLAVIIIISILTLLVLPSIVNSVRNSSEKIDDVTLNLIYNAADLYVSNHSSDFLKKDGNKYIINLSDLISEKYLKNSIKMADGQYIEENKCVQVTYDDGFNYELKEIGTCEEAKYVCEAVTSATASYFWYTTQSGTFVNTIGNIPNGNFSAGDEYICEVKPGVKYHFFVVSENGNNVNLILDRGINNDGTLATKGITKDKSTDGIYSLVEWVSVEDYEKAKADEEVWFSADNDLGPLTALKFLNNATKDWSNIPDLNETYSDEGGNYGAITLNGKARLLTEHDYSFNQRSMYLSSYTFAACDSMGVCLPSIVAYWTLSSKDDSDASVIYPSAPPFFTIADVGQKFSIRPVISLPKSYFKQKEEYVIRDFDYNNDSLTNVVISNMDTSEGFEEIAVVKINDSGKEYASILSSTTDSSLYINNNNLYFKLVAGNNVSTPRPSIDISQYIDDGQYHMVKTVYNLNEVKLYFDNILSTVERTGNPNIGDFTVSSHETEYKGNITYKYIVIRTYADNKECVLEPGPNNKWNVYGNDCSYIVNGTWVTEKE